MIVLLSKSKEKNTELKKLAEVTDSPCVFINFHETISTYAYTPWMYYTHRSPDDSNKPFFWLDLDAAPYWSFQSRNVRQGQIINIDERLANVYFREPFEDQCIDRIEWLRNNEVYAVDYYDASGYKYAVAAVSDGSEDLVKYCDKNGTPVITLWKSTGFVSVKKKCQEETYESKNQFYMAFMKEYATDCKDDTIIFCDPELRKFIPEGFRCVMFISDQLPNELKDNNYRDSLSLIVTGKPGLSDAIRQLSGDSEAPEILELGSLIDRAEKLPVQDALIVTRSQNIEHLQSLVEGLPELHFHIVAGTMMAPGLMEFDKYDNVTLYPNSPREKIMQLMDKCAFYLDINHYLEYEGIVRAAQRMDRLVLAFDNTVHQEASMPKEHIYRHEEADRMIADISRAMFDPNCLREFLEMQRNLIEITDEQREALKDYILTGHFHNS